jgi:diguanylate cyclase (GGDEF)-like protein
MQTVIKFMLTSWGYDPVLTNNGEHAWEILRSPAAPRLALLDWMIPGIDGVELCRRVRAAGREPYTYILLLSARSNSADLVLAMNAGADDYVRKPFDAQEFRARVNAGSRIVRLQRDLLAAREELRAQATRDSLTGVLNHAHILEVLARELDRCNRAGRPLGTALVNLDRFRHINDSFGHQAGDEVLREAARRLRAAAPANASIGRYGGGEFLVVVPEAGAALLRENAAGLRRAIGDAAFTAGAASFPVACSVGVASCEIPFGSDATSLLREADESLYWAKRESRAQSAAAPPAADPLASRAAARS